MSPPLKSQSDYAILTILILEKDTLHSYLLSRTSRVIAGRIRSHPASFPDEFSVCTLPAGACACGFLFVKAVDSGDYELEYFVLIRYHNTELKIHCGASFCSRSLITAARDARWFLRCNEHQIHLLFFRGFYEDLYRHRG